MGKRVALTGNEAVAYAMKQIDPDVVAAYPITPQTDIVQYFSEHVHNGLVTTEFITVESEHSAMSAAIGAAAAGSRCMTATSSQGLALMWEMIYIASSFRLPIVMPVVNRALSAPINIHCDHSDSMGARDSGWIQVYSENAQEAYDNVIQAVRIAEHPDVLLPVMVCQDGFITSHGLENLFVEDDNLVKQFVGEYQPDLYLLNAKNPMTIGPLALQNVYFEAKRQQVEAMVKAKDVIQEVALRYSEATGRSYDFFEAYRLEDAELVVVVLGSTAGTAREVVDELRDSGVKAGLLKIRVFRPFPKKEIVERLKGALAVAVMDRADTYSTIGGPVFLDICSIFLNQPQKPIFKNYIYGLGGRDVGLEDIRLVYRRLMEVAERGSLDEPITYLGVRE